MAPNRAKCPILIKNKHRGKHKSKNKKKNLRNRTNKVKQTKKLEKIQKNQFPKRKKTEKTHISQPPLQQAGFESVYLLSMRSHFCYMSFVLPRYFMAWFSLYYQKRLKVYLLRFWEINIKGSYIFQIWNKFSFKYSMLLKKLD